MRLTHIIWKAKYIEKLAVKHGVAVAEVEEVLAAKPFIRKMARGHVKNEHVYAVYGTTTAGRYLVVFYIRKVTGAVLPISARDMEPAERRYYEKER